MGSAPVISFLWPLLGLAFALVFFVYRQRSARDAERRMADYRLADMAQRLGLKIEEGDPSLNLAMAYYTHNQKKLTGGFLGDGVKETRARLAGVRAGRPIELVYHHR